MSHSDLAERDLGRPGLPASEVDSGYFWFEDDRLVYHVCFSSGRDGPVERSMLSWVRDVLGAEPPEVEAVDDVWVFGALDPEWGE